MLKRIEVWDGTNERCVRAFPKVIPESIKVTDNLLVFDQDVPRKEHLVVNLDRVLFYDIMDVLEND